MVAPNSGPGVLLRSSGGFPLVVVRMSRALRDHVVCRSNVFIEFGDSSVSMIGVDVSTVLGRRKLRLLSYGLLLVSVVVECVTRCCCWCLLLVAVGNGVRERSGKVSTNGVEPKGVGVLLRGLSKMHWAIDCKWEKGGFLTGQFWWWVSSIYFVIFLRKREKMEIWIFHSRSLVHIKELPKDMIGKKRGRFAFSLAWS